MPAVFSVDDRRTRLNVVDRSFDASDIDKIAELKRLLQKKQNPRQKVLQDTMKSKTNGHRADSKQFDHISGIERRSDNGECDQEPRIGMLV